MSSIKIRDDFYWVGAQDPDLRVFDVIMHTEYGTSYNSYVLKTPKFNVLFETVKHKCFDLFLSNIREVCDPAELDYIVVDHTEPDHAGSLEKLLDFAPEAKVLASATALTFLKDICNRPIPGIPVTDEQVIELDKYKLRFLSVPFLHWPDSIYTYIEGLETLVTCDSFGCHYADDRVCNDLIEGDFIPAYKYYFDMIMGPFKPHVQYALDRIKDLDIKMICPGHGPVLREELSKYLHLYDKWSKTEAKPEADKPKVTAAYVSAYGYTDRLAAEIVKGVKEEVDADIQLFDMVHADAEKVQQALADSDGILLGTPTVNGDALPPVMNLAMGLNGVLHNGKVAGAFGSYGWSGEGADMIMSRLRLMRMNTIEPPLKVTFKPGPEDIERAVVYGRKFGKKLKSEWVKIKKGDSMKTYWKCLVCGEIFEGALPPAVCPVCGAGAEAFVEYIKEDITYQSDSELKVAVIGSGAAAVSAAESVRKRNAKAKIDIYTREEIMPYYRPVLTKAIAEEVLDTEYFIKSDDFYEKENIGVHLGKDVSAIHRETRKLTFTDGSEAEYDKLVLATGSRCFIPPIQGCELPEVTALREKTDFDRLDELISKDKKKVVVIGGGLLGLETADSLAKLGHEVTIIEACPCILPRQLDDEGAGVLKRIIENSSVKMISGVFVDQILGGSHVSGVKIKQGDTVPCDIVIISAGIKSNIELADAAGLDVDRAIIVNSRMQTSDPDIYAAGDCAIFEGKVDGIWETAIEQGKVAGGNIAGDSVDYTPKPFGATLHAFGTKLFSIGDIGKAENVDYQHFVRKDDLQSVYKKLFFRDNTLSGGILLGDVSATNYLLSGVSTKAGLEEVKDMKLLD